MNKYNYIGELVMVYYKPWPRPGRSGSLPLLFDTEKLFMGIVVEQYSRKSVLVQIITDGDYQGCKWRLTNQSYPPFFGSHPRGHEDNKFHVLNEKKANPL